jgi:hypothetical protein
MHVAATLRRAIAKRHGRPEDGRNAWALAMSSTLPTSIINPGDRVAAPPAFVRISGVILA